MSVDRELKKRSNGKCELCSAEEHLGVHTVSPYKDTTLEHSVILCSKCTEQIVDSSKLNVNHWRLLNDSIWHELDAIKVLSYRILHALKETGAGWAEDLQDMMYMDEPTTEWANDGLPKEGDLIHRDSNGVVLNYGDSVVLIKDLPVKGSSMIAKRGTPVRNIRLDPDNEMYIEGKVEGQMIVIITDYVKKT